MNIRAKEIQEAIQILGLTNTATQEEIKRAYKLLSLSYHPDKPNGNAEKFRAINEAYILLTNPKSPLDWSDSYIITLLAICQLVDGNKQNDWSEIFFGHSHTHIVAAIIEYSKQILTSESANVPTVIQKYGHYNQTTNTYILDNPYTLNAINYTTYELMWLHAHIYSNSVEVKGTIAFTNPKKVFQNKYNLQWLLIDIIHSQLAFGYKNNEYYKEKTAVENPNSFTSYVLKNKNKIEAAIILLISAIAFPAMILSIPIVYAIPLIILCFCITLIATSLLLTSLIRFTLLPNTLYFDVYRSKPWCKETNIYTYDKMQKAFDEKKLSNHASLAPRDESNIEKISHMLNNFFAPKRAPKPQTTTTLQIEDREESLAY